MRTVGLIGVLGLLICAGCGDGGKTAKLEARVKALEERLDKLHPWLVDEHETVTNLVGIVGEMNRTSTRFNREMKELLLKQQGNWEGLRTPLESTMQSLSNKIEAESLALAGQAQGPGATLQTFHAGEEVGITFTNEGRTISDAVVIGVKRSRLLYKSSDGPGSVKLADLPKELRDRYGFDEAQAMQDELREKGIIATGKIGEAERAAQPTTQAKAKPRQESESSSGVPKDVYDRIAARAKAEWPGDYQMQQYEIRNQVKAYLNLHPQ